MDSATRSVGTHRGDAHGQTPPPLPGSVLAMPRDRGPEQPYTTLLYDAMEGLGVTVKRLSYRRLATGRFDVVHVHWPEAPLNRRSAWRAALHGAALIAGLRIARRRRARVWWTVHNLQPHEHRHPWLSARYWPRFTASVDGFVSLTHAAIPAIEARHPRLADKPRVVAPIGDYAAAFPAAVSRASAREALGLAQDAQVLLCFGQIRPYKGTVELVQAFVRTASPRLRLIVAGRPRQEELRAALVAAARDDPRIDLRLRYVESDEASRLFAAADVVVLPYRRVLNSSAAILALTLARPLLLPDTPTFRELAEQVGGGWVRLYAGALGPDTLADAAGAPAPASSTPDLSAHRWPAIARRTAEAFGADVASR